MSGIVAGFGRPKQDEIERMFSRIAHRGPFLSGMASREAMILGQNYLKADVSIQDGDIEVPVKDESGNGYRIAYDGEIGNPEELSRQVGLPGGPFLEERTILRLYRKYGPDMLDHLDDAIFSFVITDGEELFAARDLLGIKTLFYGWKDGTLYLGSELKSLLSVTEDVHEFPAGHYMDGDGILTRFEELPEFQSDGEHKSVERMAAEIREIIDKSIRSRVDFAEKTAGLLSGGMDSSVINCMASDLYKEKFGGDARLKTYAIGVGESEDIENARIMAEHIGTDHEELIVDLGEILEVLPEVIYHLESFDPSLVRSSVSNYLVSNYASQQGVRVLLSGEGGDEIFLGYTHLKDYPLDEVDAQQTQVLGYLHNNASLRLDRMNMAHSVRVVAPLISGELLDYSMTVPAEYKLRQAGDQKIEKWIFRKAFEPYLPEQITWRYKQEFSQGSGSADKLRAYFEAHIEDGEFAEAKERHPVVRSKEELYYFRIFTHHFGEHQAVDTVGQWVSH